jgi:hypothetical protein
MSLLLYLQCKICTQFKIKFYYYITLILKLIKIINVHNNFTLILKLIILKL